MGKRFQISILENIKDYDRELIVSGKSVEVLLMAKVLAEKIGRKAISELI